MTIALRTQQLIAFESGVDRVRWIRSPAATSSSTSPTRWSQPGDGLHPPRSTSSAGWSRRSSRTTRSARSPTPRSRYQQEVDAGQRIVVGVNGYTEGDERAAGDPAHRPRRSSASRSAGSRPCARARDSAEVERTLAALREAAAGDANLMDPLLDVRARPRHARARSCESLQRGVRHLHGDAGLLMRALAIVVRHRRDARGAGRPSSAADTGG